MFRIEKWSEKKQAKKNILRNQKPIYKIVQIYTQRKIRSYFRLWSTHNVRGILECQVASLYERDLQKLQKPFEITFHLSIALLSHVVMETTSIHIFFLVLLLLLLLSHIHFFLLLWTRSTGRSAASTHTSVFTLTPKILWLMLWV